MECKVSVIVPVYRVGKYINRCVKSLLRQTLKEIEIICVCEKEDDAFEVLRGYARADDRIHVIEKKNTGVSAARNAGIKAARGTYLAFVDADDWIERYALQTLYMVAESHRAQIVVYGFWPATEPRRGKRGIFGYTPKRNVLYHNNGMKALFYEHGSRPYLWNKFYNRNFWMRNQLSFDETIDIGEDQLLQFDAFGKAEIICFVKDKLYHYDIERNGSAMNVCERQRRIDDQNFKLLRAVMQHKKAHYDNLYDKEYIFWILQQYEGMADRSLECDTADRGDKAAVIKGYLEELSYRKVIGDLPEQYQILCECFINDSITEREYGTVGIPCKISDQYMNDQVAGTYEGITVLKGFSGVIRRVHEAYVFHEFRHFVVRVLIRLGLY
jgi:Glycosyltransferases involved in cell wall biogenesis